ncbi:FkbM family methyltransferase [Ketobacter sp.]
MKPRTLIMRHKEKHLTGFTKAALELHYYRPSLYKFYRAEENNPHLLHEADLGPESLVLDVGAYNGDWAKKLIKRYNPTVLAFEPDPGNYNALKKKESEYPKLTAIPYGISDKNEASEIQLSHMGSSIFDIPNASGELKTATIQLHAVDTVWKDLDLKKVSLMKINIEGGEFPLLERMIDTDLIKEVESFMIQFHEWHPGAYHRRRKIRKALAKTHNCVWDYHFVWEKWDRKL